ncbi:2`-hydroxyisoflavone reductase [Fusarium albosuccineum]|uniref:2`-hydroxyisoflavone reductase n=1 Tax=Fusarium albosuccineum TaxID=1237068 RepID=A0A8H4KZD3_9HYPO|nr:2`-hydroxyisoflavone reductase [Fusarium albosuccineum]
MAHQELSREVLDKLVAENKHEITALVRKDPSTFPSLPGVTWVQTNYEDKAELVKLLSGIHTVLCFIAVHLDPGNESQKRIIDAAIEAGVKRYAPSEWSVGANLSSSLDVMPWYAGKVEIIEYLEKLNSPQKPGAFMDYLCHPYKASKYITTIALNVDLEKEHAIVVEGSLDDYMTYTSVQDIAGVVTRAVDYEGEWPVIGGIRGNRITIGELIKISEKVKGKPFKMEWLKQEDLEAGELKTDLYPRIALPSIPKDQVESFSKMAMTGILLAMRRGVWTVSDEWNQLLPDYESTTVEALLTKAHSLGGGMKQWGIIADFAVLGATRTSLAEAWLPQLCRPHWHLPAAGHYTGIHPSRAFPGIMSDEEKERKRDKVGEFLKKNLNKGEIALKHAVGLGHQPNAVPLAPPVVDGPRRPVEVGWHPVGGVAGKWFAEDTGLGKMITEKINRYPDPTQHWAVLVGDFAHQLPRCKDENFDVIYTNERIVREEWHTFQVGETKFNDDAVRRAGESVIQSIREKQPGYNLITNNCQTYALQLLDAIKVGIVKEFGTTLAVYERILGPGKIMDLFDHGNVQVPEGGTQEPPVQEGQDTSVSFAQQVMNENTTQLEPQEELRKRKERKERKEKDGEEEEEEQQDGERGLNGKEGKKEKKSFFSRFKRS